MGIFPLGKTWVEILFLFSYIVTGFGGWMLWAFVYLLSGLLHLFVGWPGGIFLGILRAVGALLLFLYCTSFSARRHRSPAQHPVSVLVTSPYRVGVGGKQWCGVVLR